MIRVRSFVFVMVLAASMTGLSTAADTKPVAFLVRWGGQAKMDAQAEISKVNFVTDQKAWEKVWKICRPGETLPTVDFKHAIVVVTANSDPNRIMVGVMMDKDGNVTTTTASTLIGFENPQSFTFEFGLIARDGVKTINKQPVGP